MDTSLPGLLVMDQCRSESFGSSHERFIPLNSGVSGYFYPETRRVRAALPTTGRYASLAFS